MRVYIIRHGESENNLNRRWTGWFDAPLTENGKEEARKAGSFLDPIRFEKVYSSDLSRAMETAGIALPGYRFEISPFLREINVGTLACRHLSATTPEVRAITASSGYGMFGGETKVEFQQRIAKFKRELEGLSCQNVAVFSHGGWLRSFLDAIVGVVLPRHNVCCNNCTVAIFEYTDSIWRLHSWINLL